MESVYRPRCVSFVSVSFSLPLAVQIYPISFNFVFRSLANKKTWNTNVQVSSFFLLSFLPHNQLIKQISIDRPD